MKLYSKSKGIFITGTDTGVGKTLVAAAFAAVLKQQGYAVGVYKPVETGVPVAGGRDAPADGLFLQRAAGCDDPIEHIVPNRFPDPVAPLVAAENAGITLSLEQMVEGFTRLSGKYKFVIVEGAGGLLVPLTRTETNRELAAALGLPVLIVAANRLGVLNHTLLTVETLQRRNIPVFGVILNRISGTFDSSVSSNAGLLKDLLPCPIIETQYFSAFTSGVPSDDTLVRWFEPVAGTLMDTLSAAR